MEKATKSERENHYSEIDKLVRQYFSSDSGRTKVSIAAALKELLIKEWTAEAMVACCDTPTQAMEILCAVLNKFIDDASSEDL